ncbi:MAG: hypothetical protein WC879_09235 [Melioribacteraceae bacterium]
MSYKKTKKLFVQASLLLLVVALSSCGVWTDFNTYFNTYYNAKTLFERTEEEILKQKKDIFAFRETLTQGSPFQGVQSTSPNLSQPSSQFGTQQQFTQPGLQTGVQPGGIQLSGSLSQDLTKVIEKCSKILQYETGSSYFPDALFMTGKAFYYQAEYARAQRKFIELAGLGDTKYRLENKLWLAKTHLQLHDFDQGLSLIEEVKEESLKEDEEKLFNDAAITRIAFFEFREEYQKAINECSYYLSVSKDDETNALVSYQLGKIYLFLNDKENALKAFVDVLKYSPTFDTEFQSRIEHARLLKELNRVEESESELNDIRYAGKFKNYVDQVMIELGQIYYEKNETKLAVNIFREVDSTFKMNPTSGIAQAKLGEIYKTKIRDYDSSYKYYNKVAISLAPTDMKTESIKHTRDLDKYFLNRKELTDLSQQLNYILNPTRYMQDSIEYDIAYRQFLEENRRILESQNSTTGIQNQTDAGGELRRQQSLQQNQKVSTNNKALSLYQLILLGKIRKPERPHISADSIGTIYAKSLYGLSSLFFSELDVPDSAYFYYNKILSEYQNKPVKVQTLYALGIYYETMKDTVKADSLFKIIYDNYEKDPLRISAGEKLGLIKKEEKKSAAKKDEDPAENFYLEAEKKYYDKSYEDAIKSFREIYNNYPKSIFAQKSLTYAGMIYEKDLKMYDSAAAFYGILVKDYVGTPYANSVLPKYTEYQNERIKVKTENDAKQKELEEKKKESESKNEITKPITPQAETQKQIAVKDTSAVNDTLIKSRLNRLQLLERLKTNSDTTKKKLEDPK